MKFKLTIILFLQAVFSVSCNAQTRIFKIERDVYSNGELYSSKRAIIPAESFQVYDDNYIKEISKKDTILNTERYIIYKMFLSDSSIVEFKRNYFIFDLDNLMIFEGKIEQDSTFKTEWWFKEGIIIEKIEPHSDKK